MSATKKQVEQQREEMDFMPEPMPYIEQTGQNIKKSLARFQRECPVIHKGTQGYGYTYADLPAILNVINPILAKNNLGFTQPLEGDGIRTIIFHTETGETIESFVSIPQNVQLKGQNDFQVMGSAISYFRRYSLSSILGLVTDKDLDATGTQTTKINEPTKTKKTTLTNEELIRLCGAINAQKLDADGNVIDIHWAIERYELTNEQLYTLNKIKTA
jgi:hypothetical protein